MKEDLVGQIKENNKGTLMKIIACRNYSDIDVQFLDEFGYIKRNNTYSNFKNGCIKNPYDKTIYDVAYLGEGGNPTRIGNKHVPSYNVWHQIVGRCCVERISYRFAAYYGVCKLCDEWYNYQNFADWYKENEYSVEGRLHVDKDILIPGNKLYSPDTCLLVPQRINMLFLNKPNKRGLPNGIIEIKNGYSVKYCGNEYGHYKTLEEAYSIYSKAKENAIKEVAEEYRSIIPNKVYEALLRYKVDINNDKNYVCQ